MNRRFPMMLCLLTVLWLVGAPTVHAADAKKGAEQHGAGATHIGEKGVDKKPHALAPDLAVYTFVVFALVFFALWKFAWGPICRGLDAREKSITDNIEQAKQQNLEARRLLADYEKKLENASGEVREIMEEARRDAEHTQQEILAKARAEAGRERDRAIREIDQATQVALKELGEKSVDLAIDLAGKIVTTQIGPEDHARMVQDAVARFAKVDPSRN